jgi:hypothetical protein
MNNMAVPRPKRICQTQSFVCRQGFNSNSNEPLLQNYSTEQFVNVGCVSSSNLAKERKYKNRFC